MNEFNRAPAGNPAGEFPAGQPGFRILVVEEEGDLRQLTAEVLVDAGYQVEVAEDGEAAWTALQLHRHDLLITDQFLPKVSGVQLLKKIHAARMTLPVMMVTEILPTWEFALRPCLQAVTMLRKPYTMDKLLGMVKSVLPEHARGQVEAVPPKLAKPACHHWLNCLLNSAEERRVRARGLRNIKHIANFAGPVPSSGELFTRLLRL